MPLIATVAYVPALISSVLPVGQRLIYVICILSLSATAYIMESSSSFHPSSPNSQHGSLQSPLEMKHIWPANILDDTSRKYLVYANSVLSALLALGSLRLDDTHSGNNVLYLLPGGKLC